MEEKLGVTFKKGDILCEAVIQKSFYDLIRNDDVAGKLAQPDYERLEFLGDCVLGLIITEYVWNKCNAEKNVAEMVAMVTSLINGEYQAKIYNKLGIGEFVKMKKGRIREWKKQGDMVESVAGAIFVDGGIFKARNFVTKAFELEMSPGNKELKIRSLEYKLNYSFKNKRLLSQAFLGKGTVVSKIEQIGSYILSLFLVDYKTRTCDTKADEVFLQKINKPSIVNVSKPILQGIASYLNILEYVETLNENDDLGHGNLETYVLKIFGAIWKDLTKQSLYPWPILENVFYHVFNPYLVKSPKESLLDRKLDEDKAKANIREFTELANKLPYKFVDPMMLNNVVKKKGLLQNKLELIGLHVIHLSSSLQVCDTELERNTETLDFEKSVQNKMKDKLKVKLFIKMWTDTNEDKLIRILVGLMYADIKAKEGSCIFKTSQEREDITWLLNLSL